MSLDTRTVTSLASTIDDLGLTDRFPAELGTLLARAHDLAAKAHEQDDDRYQVVRATVVRDLAAGTLTPAKARDQLVAAHSGTDVANLTKQALLTASNLAGRNAGKILTDLGESILTEILAPEAERLVETVTAALADLPPEITTADDAMAAGDHAIAAWRVTVDADAKWQRILELVRRLRGESVFDGNPHDIFLIYANPYDQDDREISAHATLAEAIRRDARPRLATHDQAEQEFANLVAEKKRLEEEGETGTRRVKSVTGHGGWSPRVDASTMTEIVKQVAGAEPIPHPDTGQPMHVAGTDLGDDTPNRDLHQVAASIPRR